MRTKIRIGVLVLVSLLLIIAGTSFLPLVSASTPRGENFVANLSAAPGITTSATGVTRFHLSPDGSSLSFTLVVHDINHVFMAHIHYKDGSIIVWLYPNPNAVFASGQTACLNVLTGGSPSLCPGYVPGTVNGILVQGTLTAANLKSSDCAGCNGFTFKQLVQALETGSAFVNVHTVQNPGGEIQGTILEVS